MTYPVNLLILTSESSNIVIMEEAKTKFYESVNILEEQNVEILRKLTKLELQSKLLSRHVIADDSILDVQKYNKKELIESVITSNV